MTNKEIFFEFLEDCLKQLYHHRQIAVNCNVEARTIGLNDKIIEHCEVLKVIAKNTELSINYINQFQGDVNQALNYFPYRLFTNLEIQEDQKPGAKKNIESHSDNIELALIQLQFNLSFFQKLGFLNKSIVAIGANGSGKTSLSNGLKKYLPQNGVVISAQRILIVPTFSGISNINSTSQKLAANQVADKTYKTTYSTENQGNAYGILANLGGEFQVLLDNLLAERSAIRNRFCDSIKGGTKDLIVPETKLDKALKIWNSLIEHRIIECNDGINITLRSEDIEPYPAFQMSDGEIVALYLIAHVLQAPPSGFIIIDEPEMYLHKTILKKLWDILETERQDCIFVYLTHDLDFATSRSSAKKIWIRSFIYPAKWNVEDIPENDLPESLLLELLGSRKNILFCEGKNGKIDEKIYNILFPNFTIKPVEGCFSVISYTKAFNKLPYSTTKAFGIIDSDYHDAKRLKVLQAENVFSFSMTEPENLLLDEEFLKLMAKQLLIEEKIVDDIKLDVITQLEVEKELQISNYVSTKINNFFKDSHVSKGNTLVDVNKNLSDFNKGIKIQEWYDIKKGELENVIKQKDYSRVLS